MTALTGDQTVQLVDAYRQAGIDVSGLTGVNPFTEELSVGVAYRLEQLRAVNPKLYTELRDAAGKAPAPSLALLHAQEIQARGGPGPDSWSPELQREYLESNPVAAVEQEQQQEAALLASWEKQAEESRQRQQLANQSDPARAEALERSRLMGVSQLRQAAHASGIHPLTGMSR